MSHHDSRRALAPYLRAGLLVGLAEGLAIGRYDGLQNDPSARGWLELLAGTTQIAAVHVAAWLVLGYLLLRLRVGPLLGFRLVFTACAAVAFYSRLLLHDRNVASPFVLIAALALVWLVPYRSHGRLPGLEGLPGWARQILAGLPLLAVSYFSLAGRVPDYSYPTASRIAFYLATAAAALVLAALFLRWPRPATIAWGLALIAALTATLFGGRSASQRPDVLWVLVDTLRRDHVSPFGGLFSTPAIEQLAARGVRFSDAVTVIPKTPGSVASFFTGRYPVHHGLRTLYDPLGRDQTTVAEVFRARGYQTAAFVDNAWIARGRGFAQGFERFDGYFEIERAWGVFRYLSWTLLLDRLGPKRVRGFDGQTHASTLTDLVLERIEKQRRPFFYYLHYFEPHWPYRPPPAVAERHGGPPDGECLVNNISKTSISRGTMIFQNSLPEAENEVARHLYAGEVDDTMAEIGRLLEGLRHLGRERDTIVVFTADHGHALGDHDYYFHHGEFLYEDAVRIPLVVSWPGRVPEGLEIKAQVRSIDLAPTLLELAFGETLPELVANAGPSRGDAAELPADGRSLQAYWRGEETEPREAFIESDVKMFSENRRRPRPGILGKLRAVRDGRHKLILTPQIKGYLFELYDLLEDPLETVNRVRDPDYAQTFARLSTRLALLLPEEERRALQEIGGSEAEQPPPELDEAERKMLESLGYI